MDATTVLVRYTYYGDADLSGNVRLADFNRFAGNFGTGTRWVEGDFNYSQSVDLTDFNFLAMNFGLGGLGDYEEELDKETVEDLIEML